MWYKCLRTFTLNLFEEWSAQVLPSQPSNSKFEKRCAELFQSSFNFFNIQNLRKTEKEIQTSDLPTVLESFSVTTPTATITATTHDKAEIKSLS